MIVTYLHTNDQWSLTIQIKFTLKQVKTIIDRSVLLKHNVKYQTNRTVCCV